MKVLFLCGSLEPGQDGVGDYARRLSAEMIRQGNQVCVIALNDLKAKEITIESQVSEETVVKVLRIPNNEHSGVRYSKASDFVKEFNPEWLSLQYVPFSFQEKGLPLRLGSQLSKIGKGRKWHIMFHELWVGMDKEAPLKHFIWGKVQQEIARKIINKLSPQVIHTQCLLYQAQLNNLGFHVKYLPLFGNIPVVGTKNEKLDTNKKTITFVVFGFIHPGAPIKQFVSELIKYEQKHGIKVQLTFIGRCGTELDNWVNVCKQSAIDVNVLGEQNPDKISEILKNVDWAISSTPMLQIQKSGTVAAMHEHGLNVICVARDWTPYKLKIPSLVDGVLEFKENKLESLLKHENANHSKIFLKNIAYDFINNLV